MTQMVVDHYAPALAAHSLAALNMPMQNLGQDPALFYLAVAKQSRRNALEVLLRGQVARHVFVGNILRDLEYSAGSQSVSVLPEDFVAGFDERRSRGEAIDLTRSVVVLTNNDIGRAGASASFASIYAAYPQTIFVVWDWDNHHWLDNSQVCAAFSDLYVPAHHDNLYILSRFNWQMVGPIYSGCVQWTRRYLQAARGALVQAERSDQPLGMHVPYKGFDFRNRVISTLSQHYPTIAFSSQTFHGRGPDDRFAEWIGHKLHWIVPVLNDTPIRIFDALITGGIPLVPESLRFSPMVRDIPRDAVLFYGPLDVVNPAPLVAAGLAQFNALGEAGVLARHDYALANHHACARLDQMLDAVREVYGVVLP